MTKNKFFRGAIGRPDIQDILKQIHESKPGDDGLERLLTVVRGFARFEGVELSNAAIYEAITKAHGDDLAIVLGTYEGEIPISHKNYG